MGRNGGGKVEEMVGRLCVSNPSLVSEAATRLRPAAGDIGNSMGAVVTVVGNGTEATA